MNSGVIVLVIAAFFGALATVLFRTPRRDSAPPVTPLERVVSPTEPPAPVGEAVTPAPTPAVDPSSDILPVESPTAATPIDPLAPLPLPLETGSETSDALTRSDETSRFIPMPVADPWVTPPSSQDKPVSEPALPLPDPIAAPGDLVTLADVTYGDAIATAAPDVISPPEPPVEIMLDTPVTEAPPTSINTFMASAASMATPSAPPNVFTRGATAAPIAIAPLAPIHDPQRPTTLALQDLSQEILAWGNSQQVSQISQLRPYATHSDSTIRAYVAHALGKIAAPHAVKPEVEPIIPVLGQLSQDPDVKVRLLAVQALGGIASPQVLPYLEQALLSPSDSVAKAANTALQKASQPS